MEHLLGEEGPTPALRPVDRTHPPAPSPGEVRPER